MADDEIPEGGRGEAPEPSNVIELVEHIGKAQKVSKARAKKEKESIDGREVNRERIYLRDVVAALETWEELDGIVHFDPFTHRVMINRPVIGAKVQDGTQFPARWTPEDNIALRVYMSRWLVRIEKIQLEEAIIHVALKNSRSSAQEFFKSLDPWDGEERLDWFFVNVCGIDTADPQFEYTKRISRKFFISIMARVFRPGCQMETLIVLEGAQGVFKSSLLRAIAMKDRWFSNKLPHKLDDVDTKDHLKGKLVIELSELVQMRGKAVEEMKTFLSISEDEHRSKWGMMPAIYPRQCVFVGSTNEKRYLNDLTGNRRYWPISCGDRKIDLDLARQILPQVYAEAMAALDAGEDWWFDADDPMMLEQQEARVVEADIWGSYIEDYIRTDWPKSDLHMQRDYFIETATVLDTVLRIERAKQTDRDQKRVAKVMEGLGGISIRKKIGGKPYRGYEFKSELNQQFGKDDPENTAF